MKSLTPLAFVAIGWAVTISPARSESTDTSVPPEVASTAASETIPLITCTGTNPAVVSDVLQMATDTRDTLGPLLRLKGPWRYPVHITLVDPGTPLADKVKTEVTTVIADGTKLKIEAALPSNDPDSREFIQRQFVTALLWEKFFKPDTQFTNTTRLDVVPLWLIEGLRESLNEDPDRQREDIVKRAAFAQRAPTLAEITSLQELSDDRLLGLWQRAFCYYLVESLVHKDARRSDFQEWMASITGPNPTSANQLFPTEMGWQRELREASDRSLDVVFTWDQSAVELAAAETIDLPKGKDGDDTRICTIETVSTFPRTPEVTSAIRKKIFALTTLELRAHPSWRPIIALYRFGLNSLINDPDPTHAAKYIHDANAQRAAEMAFHQKLVDYTNWFEVTGNIPIGNSHFNSYFETAQELDKMEADPAHPNPMRARLLKVEAEF